MSQNDVVVANVEVDGETVALRYAVPREAASSVRKSDETGRVNLVAPTHAAKVANALEVGQFVGFGNKRIKAVAGTLRNSAGFDLPTRKSELTAGDLFVTDSDGRRYLINFTPYWKLVRDGKEAEYRKGIGRIA